MNMTTWKIPEQFSWWDTYTTALVTHWNIDINTSSITMQTHAGTTERTFSNPRGWVRERLHEEKTATLWRDLCFYFHDLSHKLSLVLTTIPLGRRHFSIKGRCLKPNKNVLPSSKVMFFHLACCNHAILSVRGRQSLPSLCKHFF